MDNSSAFIALVSKYLLDAITPVEEQELLAQLESEHNREMLRQIIDAKIAEGSYTDNGGNKRQCRVSRIRNGDGRDLTSQYPIDIADRRVLTDGLAPDRALDRVHVNTVASTALESRKSGGGSSVAALKQAMLGQEMVLAQAAVSQHLRPAIG